MLKVYKGCRDGMLVTMEIDPNGPNNMERSGVVDPDHAKYRCRSAKVVRIEHVLTGETAEMATSGYDEQFCYRVGEMVEEPNYSAYIEWVCGLGVHFFLTMVPAKFHALHLICFKGYTGEYKCWHDNGRLGSHGWYKDGKKDGEWEWCDGRGERFQHGLYNDGGEEGEWEWCDENGKHWKHGWYKDGEWMERT